MCHFTALIESDTNRKSSISPSRDSSLRVLFRVGQKTISVLGEGEFLSPVVVVVVAMLLAKGGWRVVTVAASSRTGSGNFFPC